MDKIQSEAYRTFGPEYSQKWLRSSSRYFNDKAPLEYASDEEHADIVLEHIAYFGNATIT